MKLKICAAALAAILLTGCSAPEASESSVEYYVTETTSDVTVTRQSVHSHYTITSTTITTAETESSAPEETGDTTASRGEESSAEDPAVPEGAVQYRISGIITAKLLCGKDPASYCTEKDGVTEFDVRRAAEAAGFRRKEDDNTKWEYRKNDQTVLLELGTPLTLENGNVILTELRYTFGEKAAEDSEESAGEQSVIISQESPRKTAYFLADGTGITKDQAALIVYLTEQLAKNPAADPLADMMPLYLSETIDGIQWYYLP